MKPRTIYRHAIFIPAMIGILSGAASWDVEAQSSPPKPAKVSTKTVPQKVPVKQRPADAEKLVKVATIHTSDGSAEKVRKTFKSAKIPVMVMGSRMYGVLVRMQDHDRALNILKVDSRKQHYWVPTQSVEKCYSQENTNVTSEPLETEIHIRSVIRM